jgi:hypothetical protein
MINLNLLLSQEILYFELLQFLVLLILYLYSYSQHGSVYSVLYSCSLGYVRELVVVVVVVVVFALISIEFDYFEGGCCCFLGLII